jgi:hypothetical protein
MFLEYLQDAPPAAQIVRDMFAQARQLLVSNSRFVVHHGISNAA